MITVSLVFVFVIVIVFVFVIVFVTLCKIFLVLSTLKAIFFGSYCVF